MKNEIMTDEQKMENIIIICDNWGYNKISAKNAIEEIKRLIE